MGMLLWCQGAVEWVMHSHILNDRMPQGHDPGLCVELHHMLNCISALHKASLVVADAGGQRSPCAMPRASCHLGPALWLCGGCKSLPTHPVWGDCPFRLSDATRKCVLAASSGACSGASRRKLGANVLQGDAWQLLGVWGLRDRLSTRSWQRIATVCFGTVSLCAMAGPEVWG